MGRYRAPRPRGTPLITAAGEARLRAELDQLWRQERPVVALAVQDAAKNGDRSENGDYIYGKKRLREIDGRVRFISKRLEILQVVRESPSDMSRIFFGATVKVIDQHEVTQVVTILGPDEFESSRNEVSIDSPIARALLGKTVGDIVRLQSPGGERELEVLDINYNGS
ncbi:transcription elongation factor GreB [Congregibacter variabilis]|uniref:Transcription elongation factor GreB n=1 Tax=Congregibacter variabilis TaxID=3081200 RepID=A0ABZ0I509_9GAMM|nr:transcription elongation factor GreB [Congregibacter sp. IMCC43200]